MLNLQNIKKNYPENLQSFDRFLLKEYLQYKILQIIFGSEYGKGLCFLGGTALRIVYESNRFSEDLDFDNFSLEPKDFEDLINIVKKSLSLEGYSVETRTVYKGAYRCYLKFPGLLNTLGLSGYADEKILVQIDTVKQPYKYEFSHFLLNKFDIFTQINVVPSDILLSKKICAALGRKTPKGRDFFDIVYLFSFTKPDYDYLRAKEGIANVGALKSRLYLLLEKVDIKALVSDVEPFLFNSADGQRVLLFKEFLEQLEG